MTWNAVPIRVVCAMRSKRLIQQNYLRWGRITETDSQMRVRAIYDIQFTRMNCVRLGNTIETVSQIKVCAMEGIQFPRMNCLQWAKTTEIVQLNKMSVIRDKHVRNQKCVQRPIRTQTIAANEPCDLLCLWLLLTPSRAGHEHSTPRPPQPWATTCIKQLNTQGMIVYKPAGSCIAP